MNSPPFPTTLKRYGQALVDLAAEREAIVCLSGDLTRQCEVDLFRDRYPERFINAGMAEANMIGMAGAMARRGLLPFVHTFGAFATRRPLDQIVNAVACPNLPVRLVGFMPGLSSPGGPSHQATDDVALMRSLPNMTVVDLADATEIGLALPAIVDLPGPVYMRLKRGETPIIFGNDHRLVLDRAHVVQRGLDVAVIAGGMMFASAIAAVAALEGVGVSVSLVNVSVIKPLDVETIVDVAKGVSGVVTAENHSIIGGLGSAVAEALAESGIGCRLRRVGLQDTFGEGARTASSLFAKYGLSSAAIVGAAWDLLGTGGTPPRVPEPDAADGEYAPV